jgi:hypothetical protein
MQRGMNRWLLPSSCAVFSKLCELSALTRRMLPAATPLPSALAVKIPSETATI